MKTEPIRISNKRRKLFFLVLMPICYVPSLFAMVFLNDMGFGMGLLTMLVSPIITFCAFAISDNTVIMRDRAITVTWQVRMLWGLYIFGILMFLLSYVYLWEGLLGYGVVADVAAALQGGAGVILVVVGIVGESG